MTKIEYRPRREINKSLKRGKPRDIKVGLLIPIPYTAATSSLAMHLFYEYINNLEDVIAYRFVYNLEEDIIESIDHNIGLNNLDLILISTSFELDYINIAHILSSLNLLPRCRKKSRPILIAGGLAPTSNPLPLSDIVDAVVIGEAEDVITDIIYVARDENPIKALESIKCVGVFPLRSRVKRCYIENLDEAYHPVAQTYSIDEEPIFGHGTRIELSRGCPYLCPFCLEAHILYPFRYRSQTVAWNIIEKNLSFNQIMKRVIIYSLSLFSISYADTLLDKLLSEGILVSIPSLRVEHINKKRLEIINMLGQKTLTIAPETLVEHYSCRIGKCVDIEKISSIIIDSYNLGYNHVKLYLVTGFPQLNLDDELNALEKLLYNIKDVKRHRFIEISLNLLIPKPWTPFQYLPPQHILDAAYRVKEFKRLCKRYNIASIDVMDPSWGFMQAIISQGDEKLSNTIIKCSLTKCTPSIFVRFINSNIDKYSYVLRGWGNEPPWINVIDMGFNPKYLEYRFHSYLTS